MSGSFLVLLKKGESHEKPQIPDSHPHNILN